MNRTPVRPMPQRIPGQHPEGTRAGSSLAADLKALYASLKVLDKRVQTETDTPGEQNVASALPLVARAIQTERTYEIATILAEACADVSPIRHVLARTSTIAYAIEATRCSPAHVMPVVTALTRIVTLTATGQTAEASALASDLVPDLRAIGINA